MSDEPKRRFGSWIGWTLLALLVLYPLSVGPAAWICNLSDSERAWSAYRQLYRPLIWCVTRTRITDQAFGWYTGLVGDRYPGESGYRSLNSRAEQHVE
jgi:hypothetical protein